MISPETETAIRALSDVDLDQQINLGARSRFQREKFAYLQTEKTRRAKEKADQQGSVEQNQKRREFRLTKISTAVAIVCSILSLVGGGGWYQEHQKTLRAEEDARLHAIEVQKAEHQRLIDADQRLVADYLQPIADLLETNSEIYNDLRKPEFVEPPNWGVLESYLIKIRRTGVPKNSEMKQRIDRLVENDLAVVTLLSKYSGYAKTAEFKTEAAAFRNHALLYSDRWKALLEVVTSGGKFRTGVTPFPEGFPAAVKAEIATRQHRS